MLRLAVILLAVAAGTAMGQTKAETGRERATEAADRAVVAPAAAWADSGYALRSAVKLPLLVNTTGTIEIDSPVGAGNITVYVNAGEILLSIVVENDINMTHASAFGLTVAGIAHTSVDNIRVLDISQGVPSLQGADDDTYRFGLASGEYSGATVAVSSAPVSAVASVALAVIAFLCVSKL